MSMTIRSLAAYSRHCAIEFRDRSASARRSADTHDLLATQALARRHRSEHVVIAKMWRFAAERDEHLAERWHKIAIRQDLLDDYE